MSSPWTPVGSRTDRPVQTRASAHLRYPGGTRCPPLHTLTWQVSSLNQMGILVPEPQRHPGAGPACLRLSQTSRLSEALVMGCPEPLSYNWTPLIEGTFPKVEKNSASSGCCNSRASGNFLLSPSLGRLTARSAGGQLPRGRTRPPAVSACLTAGSSSPIHALGLRQSLPPS